jgi:hypothetical protein
MTPNEFELRCGAVVDGLARRFAFESDETVNPVIDRLKRNLLAKYAQGFPSARPAGIAAIVDLIIGGVRTRRAEIEAGGQAVH